MKISKFNTTDACNIPSDLHLKDPFTKLPIEDENGEPLVVKVYGIHSVHSRNSLRERDRKYGRTQDLSGEDAERSGGEYLASLIAGWSENIEDDDGPIPFNRENAINLMISQDWIARQVHDHAQNLRNYDPKRSSGSGSGVGNSHGSKDDRQKQKKADGQSTKREAQS